MKQLTIIYPYTNQTVCIEDDDKAQAAYVQIKEAMAEYKEYGNDKHRTVEVDFGASGAQNITIGALVSVLITDLFGMEETIVKREVWSRRLEAKVTQALQPAAE